MTTKNRRILAVLLILIGALLLWFAPESPGGIILLVCGIAIEIIGIALEKMKGGG
jgi:membrane-bound ClpP family serine protease